jgi:hypothetical protein
MYESYANRCDQSLARFNSVQRHLLKEICTNSANCLKHLFQKGLYVTQVHAA